MNNFLDGVDFPVINDASKNILDAPLGLEEVLASLKLMQNGKALGPDGFPVDLFKKFSDLLAPLLLDMFNDSLERGPLLKHQSLSSPRKIKIPKNVAAGDLLVCLMPI